MLGWPRAWKQMELTRVKKVFPPVTGFSPSWIRQHWLQSLCCVSLVNSECWHLFWLESEELRTSYETESRRCRPTGKDSTFTCACPLWSDFLTLTYAAEMLVSNITCRGSHDAIMSFRTPLDSNNLTLWSMQSSSAPMQHCLSKWELKSHLARVLEPIPAVTGFSLQSGHTHTHILHSPSHLQVM